MFNRVEENISMIRSESFKRNTKRDFPEIRNKMPEMKNTLYEINSRLNTALEKIH